MQRLDMAYLDFRCIGIEAGVWPDADTLPFPVVIPCQTHSCRVCIVGDSIPSGGYPDIDALVTFRRDAAVGVRTADCVPLLLYAPDIGAVAAVHAGWKGTLGGIVTNVLALLADRGADMSRIQAAFGPSVCGACYEVSREMTGRFADAGFADCVIGERNLDLEAVNRRRLMAAGVPEANIRASVACTKETSRLPSWRRSHGTPARLVTWIRLV